MVQSFIASLIARFDEHLQKEVRAIIRARLYLGGIRIEDIEKVTEEIDRTIAAVEGRGQSISIQYDGKVVLVDYINGSDVTIDSIVGQFLHDFTLEYGSTGAAVLLLIGEDAIPALRQLLVADELYTRENAAWALSFIGGRKCVPDFVQLFFNLPKLLRRHPPLSYHKTLYFPDILTRGLGIPPQELLKQALFTSDIKIRRNAIELLRFLEESTHTPPRYQDTNPNELDTPLIIFGFNDTTNIFLDFLKKMQEKDPTLLTRLREKPCEELL